MSGPASFYQLVNNLLGADRNRAVSSSTDFAIWTSHAHLLKFGAWNSEHIFQYRIRLIRNRLVEQDHLSRTSSVADFGQTNYWWYLIKADTNQPIRLTQAETNSVEKSPHLVFYCVYICVTNRPNRNDVCLVSSNTLIHLLGTRRLNIEFHF